MEFEGERWPLQELATIGRKNPQLLVVDVSALPQALPAILKALRESGMGLNPQQEGTTLFISLPKYATSLLPSRLAIELAGFWVLTRFSYPFFSWISLHLHGANGIAKKLAMLSLRAVLPSFDHGVPSFY